jgi:hypothetical protein
VDGGTKWAENRRFEIPEKSWHGFSVIGIPSTALAVRGRRKKGFWLEFEENRG